MVIPRYLEVLWIYKWLVLVGIFVSVAAGLLAGFQLRDGQFETRVERTYPASTTVMLSSSSTPLFQAEIPSQVIEQPDPNSVVTDPVSLNLSDAATIYAYLVSSEEIRTRVEARIGALADDEDVTAVSRTTQPSGDENFPGRLSLPILDVVATSTDPARAELISRETNTVFQAYVLEQQEAQDLPENQRVQLQTLKESPAGEPEGSNPAIPVIVAGGGTFAAIIALIYIIHGIRIEVRKRRQSKAAAAPAASPEKAEKAEKAEPAVEEPAPAADAAEDVDGGDDEDVERTRKRLVKSGTSRD